MGTLVTPSFINIFMAPFERKYVQDCKYAQNIVTCYVDDVLLLWKGNQEELDEFGKYLNSRYELIKFSITNDANMVQYLDVEIHKKDAVLQTSLFCKPTNKNNMLHRNSFHTLQTFRGILKGQFIRARRICTQDQDYQKSIYINV